MGSYPIGKLYQAYNIREDQGYDAFQRFVKRENMPTEDIERVLSKYAYIHNPEYRVKVDKIKKEFKEKFKEIG